MNIINIKKEAYREQDVFLYYRQIECTKGVISPEQPFAGSKHSFLPDPSRLKPIVDHLPILTPRCHN